MSSAEGRAYVRTNEFRSLKDHVLSVLRRVGSIGITTPELVMVVNDETPESFTTYSNPVSGALSHLHNIDHRIVRLKQTHNGFSVYVLNDPRCILGREFYPPRPPNAPEDVDLDEVRAAAWDEGKRAAVNAHPSWWNTLTNPYRGGAS